MEKPKVNDYVTGVTVLGLFVRGFVVEVDPLDELLSHRVQYYNRKYGIELTSWVTGVQFDKKHVLRMYFNG